MPLFPPLNFCAVADNLYRSAIPNELNFQFLQTLNIKTVLVLQSPEEVDDRLYVLSWHECNLYLNVKFTLDLHCFPCLCSLSFAEDSDMSVISIESDTSNTKSMPKWGPIAEESVVRALEILMYTPNYPILITCKHGRALTGAVVGCLRKLQRWSLTSIFEEYRRYARTRLEQQHERFIE